MASRVQWLGAPPACDDGTDWQRSWQRLECEVLELVNQRRARGATCAGQPRPPVGPLRRSQVLTNAARQHARDMGERNYFDHFSQDGRSPFDRMKAAGYRGPTMGENLGGGKTTAAETVEGWMQSPQHCDNIMNGAFDELGVGYYASPSNRYRHLWVQNFGGGGPREVAPPPPPPAPVEPARRAPMLRAPPRRPRIQTSEFSQPIEQPAPVTSLPPAMMPVERPAPTAVSSRAPLVVAIVGGAALLLYFL